jgi:hypothetical protein
MSAKWPLKRGPVKSIAKIDVVSFALILFEIVVGSPAIGKTWLGVDSNQVPAIVSSVESSET